MDESWRMRMGISSSTAGSSALEPEDFDDVFGGPPRSVLARKHSMDLSGNDWFYEIFKQQPELEPQDFVSGRRLPEFVIPDRRRPKIKHAKSKSMPISRSKSSCSSVLSFDELTELNNFRSATVIRDEDVALASYTAKLRPINIPSKWISSSTSGLSKNNPTNQGLHTFGHTNTSYRENSNLVANDCNDYMMTTFEFGYPQTMPSPDIMQLSASSPISSLCQDFERNHTGNFDYQVNNTRVFMDLNSEVNNNCQATDIDEAIAWAKEKFQGWSSSNSHENHNNNIKEQESSDMI